jgi:hypothetical protein
MTSAIQAWLCWSLSGAVLVILTWGMCATIELLWVCVAMPMPYASG